MQSNYSIKYQYIFACLAAQLYSLNVTEHEMMKVLKQRIILRTGITYMTTLSIWHVFENEPVCTFGKNSSILIAAQARLRSITD